MKRYEAYRDSGIEWAGKIPKHWEVTKLKFESLLIVDGTHFTPTYKDTGVPFLRVTDIKNSQINLDSVKFISEQEHLELIKRCKPEKGDLLLSKNGTIGKTKVVDWDWKFSIFVSLCLIRLKKTYSPNLLSLFFESSLFETQIKDGSKQSTVTNLHLDKIREFILIKPPPEEQNLISRYLNKKTAQIDSLIEKLQKKIELLKEQRAVRISQAVTKGLDSDVEMKDSGIEWVGEIPKHWEVKKITYVASAVSSGTTPKADNPEYYEQGSINWLVIGDLNDGCITETKNKITELAFEEHSALKIYPVNSVLVAMYGSIGKLGILKIPATVNQAICALSFNDDQASDFWFYVLLAHRQYIISLRYGGVQQNISQEIIKSLRFPAPSNIEEQHRIARYLDKKTEQADSLVEMLSRKIELLREYRQSLISTIVTGKMRVTEDMI